MNKASNPVLECLDEHDTALPTSVLDIELGVSRSSIARALPDLEDYGLVESHPDYSTHYRLTDLGRDYLEGKIDADDLEPTDDS